MAERVGFEPTVPLPRRMLSKHVDSSTLAPLRDRTTSRGRILARRYASGKARAGLQNPICLGSDKERLAAPEAL